MSPLDRFLYVVLAAFVLVTLGPALLGRGALIDVDILTRYLPFLAIDGSSSAPFINMRGDTVDYYLPGIAATKEAFLAGQFPTWAPYELGGVPLASLPNHATLNPLSLPYFLLPLWLAPAFVKLGEFAVGVVGMVAFLGRHGVSRSAGVLAGVLFVSSGFMMMWTNWPHTRIAAFIPLLFWALERLVQERSSRDVVAVGVVVASMLLGGFPAVTVFALTFAGAYILVRAWSDYGPDLGAVASVLFRAASGVALGGALAAVQIVPFLLNIGNLGLEDRDFAGKHLPLALFLTTIVPDAVGLDLNDSPHYGPINAIEAVSFVGAVALVLAVTALVVRLPRGGAPDRSPRWFLAVAAAVLAAALWVGGPILWVLQQLPFYSTNFIGRARSVFGFLIAALAGIGFDRLLRWVGVDRWAEPDSVARGDVRRAQLTQIVGSAALLAGLALFAVLVLEAAYEYALAADETDYLSRTVRVPALLVVVAASVVVLIRFGPRMMRPVQAAMAGALVLLAVGQSAAFAHTMLPLNDRANFYPVTATHAFLQAHIGTDRYASGNGTMYPPTSDYYKLRTPVGHEFPDPRWKDLLVAVDRRVARSTTFIRFFTDMPPPGSSAVLDQLAVRYWASAPGNVVGRSDDKEPRTAESVRIDPDERVSCEIAGGALRGVEIDVAESVRSSSRGRAVLHADVHTSSGVISGERVLVSDPAAGPMETELAAGPQRVAIAGEELAGDGPYHVDIWVSGVPHSVRLHGSGGKPWCTAVVPRDDGFKLVFVEAGGIVYERLDALPRVRWASHSEVVPDANERIDALTRGISHDTVLIEDVDAPASDGGGAEVSLMSDLPERIAARVDADGAGYLVVADAVIRAGWNATVDGEAARIVPGNHAFAAIRVPAGEHVVELTYTAPGLRVGACVSGAAVVVACVLMLLPVLRRRRAASTSAG